MLAFFRFLAGTFLLIAVIAAVYDGTRSLATGGLAMTSLHRALVADRAGAARVRAERRGAGHCTRWCGTWA